MWWPFKDIEFKLTEFYLSVIKVMHGQGVFIFVDNNIPKIKRVKFGFEENKEGDNDL